MKQGLVCLLAVAWAACDTVELQQAFEAQAFAQPSGFTQTTETGEVVVADEDDWRTSPAYVTRIEISPAFPNPPGEAVSMVIPVRVRTSNTVQGGLQLVLFDADRIPRRLDNIRSARDPGAYVFKFSPALVTQKSLVRVYVIDPLGELVSYGDLQLGQ